MPECTHKHRPTIKKTLVVWLSFMLILLLICSIKWITKNFNRINYDEIMLVLDIGMHGVDSGLMWSFIKKVILRALLFSGLMGGGYYILRPRVPCVVLVFYGVLGVLLGYRVCTANLQAGSLFAYHNSDFYEQEYVVPDSVDIKFPHRNNVLVIALESMEKSYMNQELFGAPGLIPNLDRLERENMSFENYTAISGLSHTIAAITGMVAGLPLFYTGYSGIEKMRGATGIGTVFARAGYQTWAMFPASGNFSLKTKFMHNMGMQNVWDGEYIAEMLPEKPAVQPFDGVDDYTLFMATRPKIQEIIKSGRPYFLFMETVNTHCEGYFTPACRDMGFAQETMEDIARCDDKIISDFVHWFRAQDPNAVVILLDDHGQHAGEIMDKLRRVSHRPLTNVFINARAMRGVDVNRPVSAMDWFPTIIEAAGGIIPNCRLGMGTAMTARCRDVQTLREKYGDDALESEMEQPNKLYKQLVVGKTDEK